MISSITRISEEFLMLGYILDDVILTNLQKIASNSVIGKDTDKNKTEYSETYFVTIAGKNEKIEFSDLSTFKSHIKSERLRIKDIEVQYLRPHKAGVNISFKRNGKVDLSAYSSEADFQFNMDRLKREISAVDQNYNWLVKKLILSKRPIKIIATIIVIISVILALSVFYYFRAQNIGVDIDPVLIHEGNIYYENVAKAIHSDSIQQKLDTLLQGQFKGFVNAHDFIVKTRTTIYLSLTGLALCLISLFLLIVLGRLYPKSFFSISDHNKDKIKSMVRKREIWTVSIIIAFIVNIVAGTVVAVLS